MIALPPGRRTRRDLGDRLLVLVDVLDRAHGVDGVERPGGIGQLANVRPHQPVGLAVQPGVAPRPMGDDVRQIEPIRFGALLFHPVQDARVEGLVPKIQLEHSLATQIAEAAADERDLAAAVVLRRRRAAQVADIGCDLIPGAALPGARPVERQTLPGRRRPREVRVENCHRFTGHAAPPGSTPRFPRCPGRATAAGGRVARVP